MKLESYQNILVIDKEGVILTKIHYTDDLKPLIDNYIKDGFTIEVYDEFTLEASQGDNRNHFDKKGIRYSNKILLEKGFITLKDDEKIDDDAISIVKMSELEIFKKSPKSYPTKIIDKNSEGDEYLREKTIPEKYKDSLISKDEHNEYIINMRIDEYQKLDGRQNEIRRLHDLDLITGEEYKKELLGIQKEIDAIKKKYKKLN